MRTFCLVVTRLVLSAWVGAVVLFVVTGVHEVTSPHLDSTTKDHLVGLRFPAYYACGVTLLATGMAAGLVARRHPASTVRRMNAAIALTGVALLLTVADYFWVFTPLLEMVTPAGSVRPAEFLTYHRASELVNAIDVACCLAAAAVACWPRTGGSDAPAE